MEFDSPALRLFKHSYLDAAKLMTNDLKTQLAGALGIKVPPEPCAIQVAYNVYVAKMCPLTVTTPLPETVSFLPENFPHLVKLQTRLPGSNEWINAKWSIVGPSLENGDFDDLSYRCDPRRARALQGLLLLLRRPHKIHPNLRHGQRSPGNIRGKFVYVREHKKNEVWVAFTIPDPRLGKNVVTSSFYTSPRWLAECAGMPAIFERQRQRTK